MKKSPSANPAPGPESPACRRSICPVSCTLDLLGDKWTLLVIRDLFIGKKTYSEFQASPEGIPSNILANRLKRLLQDGIIDKQAYQQHPPRYQYLLTDKGRALWPVLKAIAPWANEHIPGTMDTRELQRHIEKEMNSAS